MADNKKPTDDLLKAMEKFITTKSVVGEPVVVGDTIILPMADVSFGMGIGTFSKGETGSGGVGGKIVPSAVLVIKDGSSKLISIKDQESGYNYKTFGYGTWCGKQVHFKEWCKRWF